MKGGGPPSPPEPALGDLAEECADEDAAATVHVQVVAAKGCAHAVALPCSMAAQGTPMGLLWLL
jgi:hypothetical protein